MKNFEMEMKIHIDEPPKVQLMICSGIRLSRTWKIQEMRGKVTKNSLIFSKVFKIFDGDETLPPIWRWKWTQTILTQLKLEKSSRVCNKNRKKSRKINFTILLFESARYFPFEWFSLPSSVLRSSSSSDVISLWFRDCLVKRKNKHWNEWNCF